MLGPCHGFALRPAADLCTPCLNFASSAINMPAGVEMAGALRWGSDGDSRERSYVGKAPGSEGAVDRAVCSRYRLRAGTLHAIHPVLAISPGHDDLCGGHSRPRHSDEHALRGTESRSD